ATHQFGEYAFGQHRMGEIEACELVLPRTGRNRQMFEKPVVQGAVSLEFERGERGGGALDRIPLAIGGGNAWLNGPGRAGARMARVQNAVEHWVAQIDVTGCHIDLGP